MWTQLVENGLNNNVSIQLNSGAFYLQKNQLFHIKPFTYVNGYVIINI